MRVLVLCFTLLMLSAPAVYAGAPDAESDAQRAVRYTALLEQAPLSPKAPEMRKWLMAWLVDTKDYTVNVCGDVFGKKFMKGDAPHGGELLTQQMFGNVAYQISHPGRHDEVEVQLAGIESLLKAYVAIIPGHADWHIQHFDTLLAKQSRGELEKYLTPIIRKACEKQDQ